MDEVEEMDADEAEDKLILSHRRSRCLQHRLSTCQPRQVRQWVKKMKLLQMMLLMVKKMQLLQMMLQMVKKMKLYLHNPMQDTRERDFVV